MEKYIDILSKTDLFSNIENDEILSILECFNASLRVFGKGEYVFHQGDTTSSIPLLLEGRLIIQKTDWWGRCSILNAIGHGEIFAEVYALTGRAMLNDCVAEDKCTVMFLDAVKVTGTCEASCPCHSRLIGNLFRILSEKNMTLAGKINCLSVRSTKEKVTAYLSEAAERQHSNTVTIPFDRQQLASFLAVDRSALSSVLSKMKTEGLIDYRKNRFTLHENKWKKISEFY